MKFRFAMAIGALLLTSCKSDGGFSDASATDSTAAAKVTVCPDGSILKGNKSCPTTQPTSPTPTPTTTTTVSTVTSPNGVTGETAIADNFDVNAWLYTATVPGVSADPVGAFRFVCLPGQLAKDDPIVYPGQPGKSHLHQFFGNTGTNANSTYASLRTTGGSTCTGGGEQSPQRTAYWAPAMLDGVGNAVKPDMISTYYKAIPNSNPGCGAPDATHFGYCVGMPNGLRFIFGYNMATGQGGPADLNSADQWTMGFDCVAHDDFNVSYTGKQHTLAAIASTGKCPVGAYVRAYLIIPDCWDGKNLDSADHRSHMATATVPLADGSRACPATHPYKVPEVMVQLFYLADANFVAGKWRLASDDMMGVPSTEYGKTWHADYWEAWSPVVKKLWQDNCIDKHLTCASGWLGNGQAVKGMDQALVAPAQPKVSLSGL